MACFVILLTPPPPVLRCDGTTSPYCPYLHFPQGYGVTWCNESTGFHRLQVLEPLWHRECQG
jgi:hypothetical protein